MRFCACPHRLFLPVLRIDSIPVRIPVHSKHDTIQKRTGWGQFQASRANGTAAPFSDGSRILSRNAPCRGPLQNNPCMKTVRFGRLGEIPIRRTAAGWPQRFGKTDISVRSSGRSRFFGAPSGTAGPGHCALATTVEKRKAEPPPLPGKGSAYG